jgi:hypothetical protein
MLGCPQRAQDQDRCLIAPGANGLQYIHPGLIPEHQIEYHCIGFTRFHCVDGIPYVGNNIGRNTFIRQPFADGIRESGIIFNDKNFARHNANVKAKEKEEN